MAPPAAVLYFIVPREASKVNSCNYIVTIIQQFAQPRQDFFILFSFIFIFFCRAGRRDLHGTPTGHIRCTYRASMRPQAPPYLIYSACCLHLDGRNPAARFWGAGAPAPEQGARGPRRAPPEQAPRRSLYHTAAPPVKVVQRRRPRCRRRRLISLCGVLFSTGPPPFLSPVWAFSSVLVPIDFPRSRLGRYARSACGSGADPDLRKRRHRLDGARRCRQSGSASAVSLRPGRACRGCPPDPLAGLFAFSPKPVRRPGRRRLRLLLSPGPVWRRGRRRRRLSPGALRLRGRRRLRLYGGAKSG